MRRDGGGGFIGQHLCRRLRRDGHYLDGSQRQSMGLLCGADASSLAVTAPAELILN